MVKGYWVKGYWVKGYWVKGYWVNTFNTNTAHMGGSLQVNVCPMMDVPHHR